MDTLFLAFLAQHDDAGWFRLVDRLELACHPVDRTALRIWFHFYPLALQQAMADAEAGADPGAADAGSAQDGANGKALAQQLRLDGRWRLADHIDSSHVFFYGHRHWLAVKAGVLAYATQTGAPGSLDLAAQIQEIARSIGRSSGVPSAELVGITAVGVRTLQQVGLDRFAAAVASATAPSSSAAMTSADQALAARAKDDSQGLFGRFKGDRRQWTVTFDEATPAARFRLIHSQHLTTAAGLDSRDYRSRDPRCSEGPIPVQCRSCSCGTCWVGVLGGADKLSPMEPRERAKLAACGYSDAAEDRPVIRLACMAEAFGAVSIVIPPWNGQVGKVVKKPVTSSSTGSRE